MYPNLLGGASPPQKILLFPIPIYFRNRETLGSSIAVQRFPKHASLQFTNHEENQQIFNECCDILQDIEEAISQLEVETWES